MSEYGAIAVIGIALLVWERLVLGLTYLTREARIFAPIRNPLVLHREWLARLFSCGQCTSTWSGMVAFALLWPVVHAIVELPLWSLALFPVAAICGTGVYDRLARPPVLLATSIDKLRKVLTTPAGCTLDSGGEE